MADVYGIIRLETLVNLTNEVKQKLLDEGANTVTFTEKCSGPEVLAAILLCTVMMCSDSSGVSFQDAFGVVANILKGVHKLADEKAIQYKTEEGSETEINWN